MRLLVLASLNIFIMVSFPPGRWWDQILSSVGTCIFTDFSDGKQIGTRYDFKASGVVWWVINQIPPIGMIRALPLEKLFIQLFSFVVS